MHANGSTIVGGDMAKTCPACGRSNDDDASFCQSCGAALSGAALSGPQAVAGAAPVPPGPPPQPPAAAPPPNGSHGRAWVLALLVAVVIAAAAAAAVFLLPRGDGTDEARSPTPSSDATVAVSPVPAVHHYLAGAVGAKADKLATISADGTVEPIRRFSGQQIWQIAYSPDGALLACVAGTFKHSQLWLFDAATGQGQQATAATPDVVAVDSIAWLSANELLMAGFTDTPKATGQNAELLVYDVEDDRFTPLSDAGGVALRGVAVSASRDGNRIAYVTYTDRKTDRYGMVSAKERLQLLDRGSGAITRLGENEAYFDVNARAFDDPLLSPNGGALIYRRAGSDVGTSYTVVAADGRTLMPAKETQFPAGYAWDPDGARVVFTGHSSKPADNESGLGPAVFWVYDTDSGVTDILARCPDTLVQDISWSPDGETIAWAEYDQDKYRTGRIHIMPATGGDSQLLAREALSPAWAPDAAPSLQTSPSP